jgi:RimJ/RimL family protein N-acetyltransferase
MEKSIDVDSQRRFRHPAIVKLKPLDSPELLELVAGWLSREENYQWLDFGDRRQTPTPMWLKILTQQRTNLLRVFAPDDDDTPIGVVGLSEINHHFRTARIWVVRGDPSFKGRGYATAATAAMLAIAFRELGLHAVNTGIVEGNVSVRIAERLHFNFIGRQRQCHSIDGRLCDRLWFDILASEYRVM